LFDGAARKRVRSHDPHVRRPDSTFRPTSCLSAELLAGHLPSIRPWAISSDCMPEVACCIIAITDTFFRVSTVAPINCFTPHTRRSPSTCLTENVERHASICTCTPNSEHIEDYKLPLRTSCSCCKLSATSSARPPDSPVSPIPFNPRFIRNSVDPGVLLDLENHRCVASHLDPDGQLRPVSRL
jgi:hypothetical protein